MKICDEFGFVSTRIVPAWEEGMKPRNTSAVVHRTTHIDWTKLYPDCLAHLGESKIIVWFAIEFHGIGDISVYVVAQLWKTVSALYQHLRT
jgi:hypothetical protein